MGPRGHGPIAETLASPEAKLQPSRWDVLPRFSLWAVEQRWGSGRQHGVPGCPQDVCCCTASCPLCHSWGRTDPGVLGVPAQPGERPPSARCLRRWLYEGVSRQKAEELLLRPGNHSGSFLIRESQTRRGESPRAPSPVPPPSHPHWGVEWGPSGAGPPSLAPSGNSLPRAAVSWCRCSLLRAEPLPRGPKRKKNTSRLPAAFG